MLQKALLLGVMGVVAAQQYTPLHYRRPYPVYEYEPQYGDEDDGDPYPYEFTYAVNDKYQGAYYQHSANSDGENVEGSYKVHLPDGRIQTVEYKAHPEYGYHAEVSYEGEAHHPEVYGGPGVYQRPHNAPHYGYQ